MQAGKLKKQVALQSYTESKDDYGHPVKAWTTYATVWAAVEPLSARELLQADRTVAEITHRVTIRYNSSVTQKHKVLYGTRSLQIVSMINTAEQNRELILLCAERP